MQERDAVVIVGEDTHHRLPLAAFNCTIVRLVFRFLFDVLRIEGFRVFERFGEVPALERKVEAEDRAPGADKFTRCPAFGVTPLLLGRSRFDLQDRLYLRQGLQVICVLP